MADATTTTDAELAAALQALIDQPPAVDAFDVETLSAEVTEGLLETLAGLGGDFELRKHQQAEDAELMLRGFQRLAWSAMLLRARDRENGR